jgi:hypothetical protein
VLAQIAPWQIIRYVNQHSLSANEHFNRLIQFRQAAYSLLGNAKDALFELADAVMTTPAANSFVELSCSRFFRRRWSSAYEALQDGRPDRAGLLTLYCQHMQRMPRPVLVGDHTAWPRPSAYTLRDRTVEHQPTAVPGNRPITLGHGYSTLAWLPGVQGSWALPVLHERISSQQTAIGVASTQLRRVCEQFSERPLSLWDAEYGCAPFVLATADIPADKIVRLRPNLCLYGPPPPYSGQGRPAKHGAKFRFKDAATWPEPDATQDIDDSELGRVRVRVWQDLHFRKAAQHPLIVTCIERLERKGTRRLPKFVWLAWIGNTPAALTAWWQWYMHRYTLEHWYRFAKQRLYWTLPMLGTPEQGECWSNLMPLISWQLWLARPICADIHLPWQKPLLKPTPGRVCQAMSDLFGQIGTPAQLPKPRGKSPGWPTGQPRIRRQRYPVVKKGAPKAEMRVLAT